MRWGGDEYSDGEAALEEDAGEIEEGDNMAHGRERENEDVCAVGLVGGGHGSFLCLRFLKMIPQGEESGTVSFHKYIRGC